MSIKQFSSNDLTIEKQDLVYDGFLNCIKYSFDINYLPVVKAVQ